MAGGVRVLRRRIKATRSTKKITKAMELVATSRIAKAQERVAAARDIPVQGGKGLDDIPEPIADDEEGS